VRLSVLAGIMAYAFVAQTRVRMAAAKFARDGGTESGGEEIDMPESASACNVQSRHSENGEREGPHNSPYNRHGTAPMLVGAAGV